MPAIEGKRRLSAQAGEMGESTPSPSVGIVPVYRTHWEPVGREYPAKYTDRETQIGKRDGERSPFRELDRADGRPFGQRAAGRRGCYRNGPAGGGSSQ